MMSETGTLNTLQEDIDYNTYKLNDTMEVIQSTSCKERTFPWKNRSPRESERDVVVVRGPVPCMPSNLDAGSTEHVAAWQSKHKF